MINNIEVAISLGYLKVVKDLIIKPDQLRKYPDNKVVILTTGGQGEELAGLPRMARGEHRQIRLKKGDTAIVSANAIPGNERPQQKMVTELSKLGVNVVYSKMLDIHTSGHAKQDELRLMMEITKPRYFIPIHGEHHMLVAHGQLAESVGMDQKDIFVINNGQILELEKTSAHVSPETVPATYLFTNESGHGDVDEETKSHRHQMHAEGMVTIIATYDGITGKIIGSPNIVSRGFVFVKNNEQLFKELGHEIKKVLNNRLGSIDKSDIEHTIAKNAQAFLLQKTGRTPFILPIAVFTK
jgi:ribonuclease J